MKFLRPDGAPDWADTVFGPAQLPGMGARALFDEALKRPPLWLGAAMILRNLLVAPFGLRGKLEGQGHFLTRLPVVTERPDHFETGMRDRHLTFTLSVRLRSDEVFVTTSIWFNAPLGKIYLAVIKPGHILATRQIASRIAGPLTRVLGDPLEGNTA